MWYFSPSPNYGVSAPQPTSRWFLSAFYPTPWPLGLRFLTMALRAALDDYCAAVDGSVKAASVPGQPTEPQTVAGLSDMGLEELKRLLPGSVLELEDGSFAFLPLTHAVIGQAGGEIKLLVKTGDAAAGIQRSLAWAGENIKQIAVGVLSTASKDGANTAPLKFASRSFVRPRPSSSQRPHPLNEGAPQAHLPHSTPCRGRA